MNKKKRKFSLAFLLIMVLGITIGYSLLSTTLKINGTAGVKSNSWDVYWDSESITVTNGSVSAEDPTVTNKTTASYEVTLELPGDFYEFTIDAVNNGSVDAMIDDIVTTITDVNDEEATLPSYIKYSITYSDGIAVAKNHLLAKKSDDTATRETYKVRIEYDREATTLPATDLTYKVNTTITYQQADDTAIPKPVFILPTGKTATTLAVGDELCVSDQCFNFVRYDGDSAVLLAKYNLNVGESALDSETFKQNSEVLGYTATTIYGNVAFSATNYWSSLNLTYPASVYDNSYKTAPDFNGIGYGTTGYSIAYYVEKYKTLLEEDYGAIIKNSRLLTYDEVTNSNIGCDASSYTCPTTGFINNTSFWIDAIEEDDSIWYIDYSGSFYLNSYDYEFSYGVRPVIVIDKKNL